MLDEVARMHPADAVTRVRVPTRADGTYEIWLERRGDERYVYADPYTGRILGERGAHSYPLGWLFFWHTKLLSGRTGQLVVGVLGALLFALAVSGIILWWPRRSAAIGPSLSIALRSGSARLNLDLHRAVGFYASWLLLAASFTGLSLVFPRAFQRGLEAATRSASAPTGPRALSTPMLPPLPVDTLLAIAERAQPGGAVSYIYAASGDPGSTVRIRKRLPGELHQNGKSFVHLDPRTGAVLLVEDGRGASLGDRAYSALYPIHTGAALGLPTRLLAMMTGLAPALLAVTGAAVWWRRRRFRRMLRRGARTAALCRCAPETH
jgi:uncharacterized iron-regulated membrane protein